MVILLISISARGMVSLCGMLLITPLTSSSWNKSLVYDQAHALAGEFKRKGASMSLGPAVLGPLGRTARGGRNWEGFGADPYFSGILGAHAVKATQEKGLMACSKVSILSTIDLCMHELMPPSTLSEMNKKPNASRTMTQKITGPLSRAHLTSMTRRCMRCICGLLLTLSMPGLPVSVSHTTSPQ